LLNNELLYSKKWTFQEIRVYSSIILEKVSVVLYNIIVH
jgi:hypothetical protein